MENRMNPLPLRTGPSVAIYALAVFVLFVLPLSMAMLLFSSIRDPKSFQFAYMCAASLASISALVATVVQWNRNRGVALGYLMIAASTAFITWGLYAPGLKLILGICSLTAAVLACALMYRPLSSFLRQRRAGT